MVVIIDDSELFRLNVKSAIEKKFDVEIVELDTVRSMREFFSSKPLDDILLVILDLNLPDGNGLNEISKIIEKNRSKQIPFIVVSKEINPGIVPLAKQSGAADIIAKPINPDQLINTIIKKYPDVFIPREKGNKPIESYINAINNELLKAQKGNYPISLFIVEISTHIDLYNGGESALSLLDSEEKKSLNLTMRLRSSEMSQVFPIANNTSLVIAPFVDKSNLESVTFYFKETLMKAGTIKDDRELHVVSTVYPDDAKYAMDLIKNLKSKLQQKHNDNETIY